ncbi:NADP-dependent oxidoreductase [Saccharothrix sp. S26]|uniref:NADP-dependent oxidoreductase n=1 Tax=Saccharothrix sp. S26 TaxID=2907215 RepID=UPI001F33136E|nr:NADP-dependent oxidoreductase [Saccharothrix sp. S26]MCE7000602.1 NADP-dependent oxidoreductase [Saccharothrix sp. S26]
MTNEMRAVVVEAFGEPEVMRVRQVARPEPAHDEIVVEVRAAGVNAFDWLVRRHGFWFTTPWVPGWDVSGVVASVPPGENRFEVGDEVFGMPHLPRQAGAYAEYVAAPARHFARKPANVDHVHAAALPLASLTAWQVLTEAADVKPGDRVLVHAAAGGVGHLAVQVAKSLGAWVIGTASAGKHDLLRELGADELVDYRTRDFGELAAVDVVVDLVGGDYEERSMRVLEPGGVYVGLTDPSRLPELRAKAEPLGVRATTVSVVPDHAALEHLARLVERGELRAVVAETFPLEDVVKAHEVGEANRTAGKLVLTL